jgi:hypothetical protein
VSWKRAALVFGLCAVALLPVMAQTLSLLRDARAHVVAPLPSLGQFLRSLEPALVLGCAAALWLIARVRRWRPDARKLSLCAIVLIAAWWLCQPILLYAFSWLTGDVVFVPRYLQLALPGAALASTALGCCSFRDNGASPGRITTTPIGARPRAPSTNSKPPGRSP